MDNRPGTLLLRSPVRTSKPPISEALEDLQAQLKQERDPQRRRRIHLLVLFRSGEVTSSKQAAQHLAVHRNTISNWLSLYRTGGLEALLHIQTPKPEAEQRTLPPEVWQALQERLQGQGFSGFTEVRRWLGSDHGLEVPYSTVHSLVRYRLKAKLKRARPVHGKKRLPKPGPFPSASPKW